MKKSKKIQNNSSSDSEDQDDRNSITSARSQKINVHYSSEGEAELYEGPCKKNQCHQKMIVFKNNKLYDECKMNHDSSSSSSSEEEEFTHDVSKHKKHVLENAPSVHNLFHAWWMVLHTTALRYPDYPSQEDQQRAHTFYSLVGGLLPCEQKCAKHYNHNWTRISIDLTSNQSLHEWITDVHNDVNCRTGKRTWSYEESRNYWSQFLNDAVNDNTDKVCILGKWVSDNGNKYDYRSQKCKSMTHKKVITTTTQKEDEHKKSTKLKCVKVRGKLCFEN